MGRKEREKTIVNTRLCDPLNEEVMHTTKKVKGG